MEVSTPRTSRLNRSRLGFASWGIADQAMSSLSNFGVGLVAARSSSAEDYGAFSVAFATAVIGIGVVRALVADVYSVRYAGGSSTGPIPGGGFDPEAGPGAEPAAEWAAAEAELLAEGVSVDDPNLTVDLGYTEEPAGRYPHAGGAWGAALLMSIAASVICLVAAALASGALRSSLFVLAVGMPFLVLQDVARFICIARRDAFGATLSDGTWVVTFFGAIAALTVVDGHSPGATAALGAWVFGAACGVAVAMLRMHVLPRVLEGYTFARRVWTHSARYIIDWVALGATAQMGSYLLGFTAGLAVLGELRTGLLLIGPVNIVIMGATMVLVPELTRYRRRTGDRLIRIAIVISVALELVSLLWLGAVALLPDSVLEALLGDAASGARSLLPQLVLLVTAAMLAQGPVVALRATGDVKRGTRASIPVAPFNLFGASIGAAVLGGASGALIGALTASVVSGTLASYQLVVATRSSPIHFDEEERTAGAK